MNTDVIDVLTTQYVIDVSESPVEVVDTTISHIITEVSATMEVVDTSVFASEVIISEPAVSDVIEIAVAQAEISSQITNTELITEVFSVNSEDLDVRTKRVDFVSDSLLYKGVAPPGTPETSPGWRISRVSIANDGDISEIFAEGTVSFDKIWNDRLTYSYL